MATDIRGPQRGPDFRTPALMFYSRPFVTKLGATMKHKPVTRLANAIVTPKWCKKCHRNHSRSVACKLMQTDRGWRTMRGYIG